MNWDNDLVPLFPQPLTFAGAEQLTDSNDLTSVLGRRSGLLPMAVQENNPRGFRRGSSQNLSGFGFSRRLPHHYGEVKV